MSGVVSEKIGQLLDELAKELVNVACDTYPAPIDSELVLHFIDSVNVEDEVKDRAAKLMFPDTEPD